MLCENECFGCTDPQACNYDPDATIDDESCILVSETVYHDIHEGQNLLGYFGTPMDVNADGYITIGDQIPDQFEEFVLTIIGEGISATLLNGNWIGSLQVLENGKGYWIKFSQNINGFYFE